MAILFRPKEERFFSSNKVKTRDGILSQSEGICKELIKALTMFSEESNHLQEQIPHWIEKSNGYIWKYWKNSNDDGILITHMFSKSYLHKDLIRFNNSNEIESKINTEYSDPVTFIRSIENEILTEDGGKYKTALKSLSDFKKDKFYMDFFLYLGLCLNIKDLFKKEEPHKVLSDFWKGTIKPQKNNINLTDKNQLKYIIASCVKNYMKPECNEELDRLLEELEPSVKSKLRL